MKKGFLLVPFALLGLAAFTAQAQESPRNVETEAKGPSIQRIISITDSGWSTNTLTSDVYAFIFDQKGLMAGLGIQGSKITRIDK